MEEGEKKKRRQTDKMVEKNTSMVYNSMHVCVCICYLYVCICMGDDDNSGALSWAARIIVGIDFGHLINAWLPIDEIGWLMGLWERESSTQEKTACCYYVMPQGKTTKVEEIYKKQSVCLLSLFLVSFYYLN